MYVMTVVTMAGASDGGGAGFGGKPRMPGEQVMPVLPEIEGINWKPTGHVSTLLLTQLAPLSVKPTGQAPLPLGAWALGT